MSLISIIRVSVGEVGVKPGTIKMITTDDLATITTAGYLNGIGNQLQSVDIAPSDVVECLYSYNVTTDAGTLVYLQPSISNGVITLNVAPNPNTIALAQDLIFVGSAGGVATAVAMSGDATIIADGTLTIANDAITTAKILNANVTLAKLAAGITPSHVIKFADQHTTVGGAAAEAIAVAGALVTDLAFVQMVDQGTGVVTIVDAVVTPDTLTVTFSGDPGNDAIINYQIIRAAA